MRSSSNPTFASFRDGSRGGGPDFRGSFGARSTGGGQFGPVDDQAAGPGFAHDAGPVIAAGEDRMTLDNVITTTSLSLATALAVGAAVVWSGIANPVLLIGALIGAFVLSMIIAVKQSTNPALVLTYAALEGVVLGAVTAFYEQQTRGIAGMAVLATVGVFAGMLLVHKLRIIRVSSGFLKGLLAAMIGIVVLSFGSMLLSFFGISTGLRSGGTLAIGFSLVCIVVASLNFLVDFHFIEEATRAGVPKRAAWYFGFSLMVTLVWLYLEILRLLSYIMRRD